LGTRRSSPLPVLDAGQCNHGWGLMGTDDSPLAILDGRQIGPQNEVSTIREKLEKFYRRERRKRRRGRRNLNLGRTGEVHKIIQNFAAQRTKAVKWDSIHHEAHEGHEGRT
jgi:hypothetical protein